MENAKQSSKGIHKVYTKADVGCYADGSLGHDHIRYKLVCLLQELRIVAPEKFVWRQCGYISADLRGAPSSDFSEEQEAMDLLNAWACTQDVAFTIEDGDLLLVLVGDDA